MFIKLRISYYFWAYFNYVELQYEGEKRNYLVGITIWNNNAVDAIAEISLVT